MARTAEELITKMTADATGFLSGVSKADKSVKSFEKTNATTGKKISTIWKAVIASAIVVAGVKIAKAAIKIGKDLALLGDKSLSLKKSFEGLAEAAGASSEKLLADMKKATKGTIAEIDLLSTANKMMLLGLDTSMFDEVMEVARRTAKATGQDINYMIESLSMGLGRQSKMILDNLGIVFDTATAYEWYAETLGKTASQLTEVEKKLGFQTYAMKIASENVEKLGKDTLTLTEVGGMFTAKWADLKAFIGEELVKAIQTVIGRFGGWENTMKIVDDFIEGTLKPHIVTFIGKIKELGDKISGVDYEPFITAVKDLGGALGSLATSIMTVGSAYDETKSDWQGFLDTATAVLGVLKKIVQFITIVVGLIKLIGENIAFAINLITTEIWGFDKGFKAGETTTEKFKLGLFGAKEAINLMGGSLSETGRKLEEDLIDAVKRFIGIEISPKDVVINHNFPKVIRDFDGMRRNLPDIERTVTYTTRMVGGRLTAGLRNYQFGGIVPKTQAILAHGGEMLLTKADQRNFFNLIRQPRVSKETRRNIEIHLHNEYNEKLTSETFARLFAQKVGDLI